MSRKGIQNNSYPRCRDFRKAVNLAQLTHAHFQHSPRMAGIELEQHLRQTDQIVEIAPCFEAGAGLLQNRGKHLLGSCFAVTTRNADHGERKTPPVEQSQIAKSPQCVRNCYDRTIPREIFLGHLLCHNNPDAIADNCSDKIMTVKALSPDGDKEHARLNGARIS